VVASVIIDTITNDESLAGPMISHYRAWQVERGASLEEIEKELK
jgi:hypothetical protein